MRASQDEDKDKKFLSFASILPDEDLKSDDSQADEDKDKDFLSFTGILPDKELKSDDWQAGLG